MVGHASTASAHAIVDSIEPADGSALLSAPEHVVVTFSEPMLADGLSVEVTAPNLDPQPTAVVALDPADATRVIVRLGALDNGTYQVRVSARDAEDLHEVIARSSFAIGGVAPPPSSPVIAGPEPIETGARWMFATGLALLIGVTALRTRWPDVPIDRPRRLRALARAGLVLALFGRVGVLVARMVTLGGSRSDAARTVLDTTDARRLLLVLIALGCVAMLEVPQRAAWLDVSLRAGSHLTCRQALSWLGVVNLAVLAAWGGHSALDGSVEPGMVVAKTGHLLGLGLWVGVLGVGVAVSANRAARRSTLAAMSQVALAGALLTVVSGVVLTSRLVVSITALTSTAYGLLLVTKIALVVGAAGLGLGMLRSRRSHRAFGELGMLATVVLIGTAMATATPAIDRGFTNASVTVTAPAPALAADDLLLQIRAIPARPGTNSLELRAGETRRPSPGAITSIEITAAGAVTTAFPSTAGLAFVDGIDLPAGQSAVDVVVHRAGWPDTAASLVVATDVPAWRHRPVVSSARIRWPLLGLASLIALIGATALYRRHSNGSGRGSLSSLNRRTQPSHPSSQRAPRNAVRAPPDPCPYVGPSPLAGTAPGSDAGLAELPRCRKGPVHDTASTYAAREIAGIDRLGAGATVG